MCKKIITVVSMFLVLQGYAQQWPAITSETKPWTRWWWMGSAVDEKGIDKQLKELIVKVSAVLKWCLFTAPSAMKKSILTIYRHNG